MSVVRRSNIYGPLKVWDEAVTGHRYVIGADVAEGKEKPDTMRFRKPGATRFSEDQPDFSAAMVVDVDTGQHVASWHSGSVEPWEFGQVLAALGEEYHMAEIIPEINSIGFSVLEQLSKGVMYPNIYRAKVYNQIDADPLSTQLGWRTTALTKPILIGRLQEIMHSGELFTRDESLISELRTMEIDDQGRAAAKGRNKDDRVIAIALAYQARYEMLNGMLDMAAERTPDRLSEADRRVWNHMAKMKEKSENERLISRRPFDFRVRPRVGGRNGRQSFRKNHF